MRVLVVGGGGREHALIWRLAQNPTVDRLYAAPGNAGIAQEATCLPIAADDIEGIVEAVEHEGIDLTVVGPEVPLVAGLVDELESAGRRVFGPSKDGARIEGSKAWTKELCERYGIPAAGSRTFSDVAPAVAYLDTLDPPYVVKADGLAAGKGVVIAEDRPTAVAVIEACLVDRAFGKAGEKVLVEEHLTGWEVSAFALSDGRDVLPLVMAQDFKRLGDGDTGPNTGGMGSYSPVPLVDERTAVRIWDEIVRRAVGAMESEGVRYRGMLYAGVIVTEEGPKLLEFNCRFGDPETQAVVPRIRSDLGELLLASVEGNLSNYRVGLSPNACVTVVIASGGYPGGYRTGLEITGLEDAAALEGVIVFHAGTAQEQDRVVTAGGRVLGVSALGQTIAEARARAYEACSLITFEGMHYRTDIAERAAEEGL
jgi:phosphoribosylamine--glycine ligase